MSASTLLPTDVPSTARQQREDQARPLPVLSNPLSLAKSATAPSSSGHDAKLQPDQGGPWLQASPYPEFEHQLDLSTLDTPNRLLALALTTLEESTPAYAVTKYVEAFKWSEMFAVLRSLADAEHYEFPRTEFYVVDFRSKLKKELDHERLANLDKQSHREATVSGGLLKYWFGSADSEGRNLATCLWRNKDDAIAGGSGPWHHQARTTVPLHYESISVVGIRLVVEAGVEGWKFEPFSSYSG